MFRTLFAAVMPLVLAACTAAGRPADIMPGSSPADSVAGIRNTHHHTAKMKYKRS